MSEIIDGIVVETPPPAQPIDDIDRIIAGYQGKAEFATPQPLPGQSIYQTPPTAPGPLPFISHDPSQNPRQEYYVRGKKKGQPKPPRPGTAPPLNPAGQLSIQATVFITGAIFITMVDLLIPLIITGVYNWMQSKKKNSVLMDYEKMKMTESQKKDLAPVGDAVVRELKLNGSPTVLFLLGLAGVYFMNFIMNKSLVEKLAQKEQRQNEKQDNKENFRAPVNNNYGQTSGMGAS